MSFNNSFVLGICMLCMSCHAFASADTIAYRIQGQCSPRDFRIPIYSEFKVPQNAKRIEVKQQFKASDNKKCNLDLGVFDEKGYRLNTPGFRGWSGGYRRDFFIDADTATPGYMPGPIRTGKWHVVQMLTSKNKLIDWELEVKVILKPTTKKPQTATPEYKGRRAALALSPKDGKPKARYYKIDTHVHSFHSDGKWSPAELIQLGKQNGLDGLVSTDHNTLSPQKEWGKVQDSAFLVINGMEVTYTQGHWNVIPIEPDNWVDFRVHMNDKEGLAAVLKQARKGKGMAFANHPGAIPFLYDASLMDGIEVWNGKWGPSNEKALVLWNNLLCACKHTIALAGTDLHKGNTIGMPCSAIWGKEMSQESLVEGIHKGNLYLAQDPSVDIRIKAFYKNKQEETFVMGETIIRKDIIMVEFQSTHSGILSFIDPTGTFQQLEAAANTPYTLEVPSNAYFVRIELRDTSNKMIALSNPFYIVPSTNEFPLIPKL